MTEYQKQVVALAEKLRAEASRDEFEGCTLAEIALEIHDLVLGEVEA
jgi:hypothetical protein